MSLTAPLRELLGKATPKRWKALYWPLPEPTYHVGLLPENIVSSRSERLTEGDTRAIEVFGRLAEPLLDVVDAADKLNELRLYPSHSEAWDALGAALAVLRPALDREEHA